MAEVRGCRQCGADRGDDDADGLCLACRGATGDAQATPQLSTGPFSLVGDAATTAGVGVSIPSLKVLGLLGRGGMGTVYKARQLKLDRLVALKILSPAAEAGGAFVERFLREARALARLSHPHIVTVHDFGEAGEVFYFVMELVEGGSLRQLLRSRRLMPEEALSLVVQMCDALQYAHEEGVVHRDIKPENILLDRRGRVKVADFGLAKLLGATPAGYTLTGSRQVMGTPHYMAPEQWEKAHAVDHRADVYALGVVLYEMLTGELPLGRFAPPSQLGQVDARLDEVVLRALEKDPAKRYQRVADLSADLRAIASVYSGPTTTPHPSSEPATLAERPAGDQALWAALKQAQGPATGLTVAGALTLLQTVLILLNASIFGSSSDLIYEGWTMVFGPAFGVVTLLAARKMRWLEAPELVLIGSILAMVPLGPTWAVGFPMGIWVLLILRKPEVQAAFAAPKPWPAEPFAWARLVPRTTTTRGALCCFVGGALGLAPWGPFEGRDVFPGVQSLHGLVATLLLLALFVVLLPVRRKDPGAGRGRAPWVLKLLGVLAPLAGLALIILFLALLLAMGGVAGGLPASAWVQLGALVALALLLVATLLFHRVDWPTIALALVGLAVIVLSGAFLAVSWSVDLDRYLVLTSPKGRLGSATPVPFLVLACGVYLVWLGWIRFRRRHDPLPTASR